MRVNITSKNGLTLKTGATYVAEDIAVWLSDTDSANLVAWNIKDGVSILGVKGTAQTVTGGTINITNNGTHNVAGYSSANVNVPIPSGYIKPSGNIAISTSSPTDVKKYATATISDANLKAENIKNGVTILGYAGTFTNDGTATVSDMLSGKTAYVKGEKLTGNIATYDGSMTNGIEHICSGGGGSSIKTCNVTIDTGPYGGDPILYCSALVFDNNALSHYVYSDENEDFYDNTITIPNVVCGSIIVINSNVYYGEESGVCFFIEGTAVALNTHRTNYSNFILTIQAPLEQGEECTIGFGADL